MDSIWNYIIFPFPFLPQNTLIKPTPVSFKFMASFSLSCCSFLWLQLPFAPPSLRLYWDPFYLHDPPLAQISPTQKITGYVGLSVVGLFYLM